jgi:hypothetical protein
MELWRLEVWQLELSQLERGRQELIHRVASRLPVVIEQDDARVPIRKFADKAALDAP